MGKGGATIKVRRGERGLPPPVCRGGGGLKEPIYRHSKHSGFSMYIYKLLALHAVAPELGAFYRTNRMYHDLAQVRP